MADKKRQRKARSWPPLKEVVESLALGAAVVGVFLLVFQTYSQSQSLDEQVRSSKLERRNTLAAQYQAIQEREFEDPALYLSLFEVPGEQLTPDEWVATSLLAIAPQADLSEPATTEDLDHILYTRDSPDAIAPGTERLRQLTLHAESYLNFLVDVAEYRANDVIRGAEAEGWYVILDLGILCHPVTLWALDLADDSDYLPAELATRISAAARSDPFCADVASAFYSEILEPGWQGAEVDDGA